MSIRMSSPGGGAPAPQYTPNQIAAMLANPQYRAQAEQFLRGQFGRITPQASGRTYTLRGMTSSDDNGTLINQTPYYTDPGISSWYKAGDWTAGREGRFAGTQAPTGDFMAIMSGQGDEFSPGFQTLGYTVDMTPDFRDERGYGRYVGNYDAQGNLTGITFQRRNLSQGWIGDNMGTWGPLLVGGAAALGGGLFAGAGGGAAAPISASTPSWVAGMPTAAGAGLEAGLAGVGSTWAGGAAGSAAAAGGGGLFGQLGSSLSKLGSAFGGGNMGWFDTALQLGGAFLNKRSADRSAGRLMGLSAEQEAQRRNAYENYASGLSGLARNYQFRPVTSRTPLGTAGINAQGEAYATLSPELQRQSSQFGTLGNAEFNQLMGLDRGGMAADRLAQLRELQAPGDLAAENAMVSRLQRMGMLGAGGASGSNPWVKALTESRATRDLQSAYDVTDWVERNIQQRMANMQGLYGSQQGVMDLGIRNLGVAGDWTSRMADLTGRNFDMQDAILRARLTGNLPSDAFYGAQAQAEAARLQGSQGLIRGVLSAGTGLFSNSRQAPAPISVSTPSYVGPSSGGYFGAYTTPVSMPSVERKPLY